MISFVFAMLVQVVTAAWAPPVQAQWAGDGSNIKARMASDDKPVSMNGSAALTVILSSNDGKLRVSPYITATRGIAFEVIDQNGKQVAPREPIAISPPAPPLDEGKLTVVTPNSPLEIKIGVRATNVFPNPGRYRIRALIKLMSIAGPTAYQQLRTNYVTVEVSA